MLSLVNPTDPSSAEAMPSIKPSVRYPALIPMEPGVYAVTTAVSDDNGGSITGSSDYLVIYDPDGGFVTGGGWIESPLGAYEPDPELTGKATFGFVSRYKKVASWLDGSTEFQFQADGFNFHSDSYDWLVVNQAGTNAQFKGSGKVNVRLAPNRTAYRFMLWAADGSPDIFRIRVWYEDGLEVVVYDNAFEQSVSGGNIAIHAGK